MDCAVRKFSTRCAPHRIQARRSSCVKKYRFSEETNHDAPCLARAAVRGMERHVRNAAHVDTDRRQDKARANAVAEPHVASDALSVGRGPHHRKDAVRRRGAPNLADRVTRDAYSHEVSSAGFWPGGEIAPYPLFYSYAYPEPKGFADAHVRPLSARYDGTLHEFVLPYDDVRRADDPEATLLAFLQSTYAAAADLGAWDRGSLEVSAEALRGLNAA